MLRHFLPGQILQEQNVTQPCTLVSIEWPFFLTCFHSVPTAHHVTDPRDDSCAHSGLCLQNVFFPASTQSTGVWTVAALWNTENNYPAIHRPRSTFLTKEQKKHVALATLDWNNCWVALGKSSSCIEQILATELMVNFDCIFMFTANKSKRAKTAHILSPLCGGLTENNPHTQTANVRRGTTICAILYSSSQNSFSLLFKSLVFCT